jgi:hypothetical protein
MDSGAGVAIAVRLRPMNAKEEAGNALPVVTANSQRNDVTLIRGAGNRQCKQTYNFDAVFGSFSEQSDVFETIRPLVDDVLQGYEATVRRPRASSGRSRGARRDRDPRCSSQVFAYGQTGTGKTHTMEGDLRSDQQKGVIPRAVEVRVARTCRAFAVRGRLRHACARARGEPAEWAVRTGARRPSSSSCARRSTRARR